MNKTRTHVKRYPFSRWDLERELIPVEDRKPCDYCGHHAGRFIYWINPDSIGDRSSPIKGAFCSKSCMANYHDFQDNE